jgi:hypothetical protein
MLGMGLGFYQVCEQRCEQRQILSYAQRFMLKQLLLLEQRLKHPEYPNMVKGLEGMQKAHQILYERGASGVLIGGLAEAVWNQRRKPEDLYKHKDVDVAVLDESFLLMENFEGGIDWWIPKKGRVTISSDAGSIEGIEKKWYENGAGVILNFGIDKKVDLNPGLYIPSSDWVIDMREYEANANIDYSNVKVELGEEVFEKFREKIKEKVKTRMPKFIQDSFKSYILSSTRFSVSLEEFDIEIVRAINRYREQ